MAFLSDYYQHLRGSGNLMLSDLIVAIMGMVFRGPGLMDPHFAHPDSLLYAMCYAVPFITWAALYCSSLAGIYTRILLVVT